MDALVLAVAIVNRLRGRPALALPEDVGPLELAAFVAVGGLLQLIEELTGDLRAVFADRARYLELRAA